ncbi:hypothetical protein [Mycoplasma suis]|uniref:Uncharacterized protein n=2 Tax=Mycoplasma suis TaxID=57372 RepID=F0QQB4_MYCSL|nr:hypothetical protein [Mycoplasma suis]ADX97684.1 hypothetical protein MSU_0140 [Mycoplasma suis str. Illinois]CBZ40223.1 hypothetical protein MSUIS_01300 [Mycoplasma suis KI3806]
MSDKKVNCDFLDIEKKEVKKNLEQECKKFIDTFWKDESGKKPALWIRADKGKIKEALKNYSWNFENNLETDEPKNWEDSKNNLTCNKKLENQKVIVMCHHKT